MSYDKGQLAATNTYRLSKRFLGLLVSLLGLASLLTACGGDQATTPFASSALPTLAPTVTPVPPPAVSNLGSDSLGVTQIKTTLTGNGSSFAGPIYDRWRDRNNPNSFVNAKNSPNVTIDYTVSSSGAGRAALLTSPVSSVDFAGSDTPFNATELAQAGSRGQVVHVPTAVGAVVAIYNLKDIQHLRLSGPTLAGIFLGTIKTWDDPAIKNDNPDATLPAQPIKVAIRNRTTKSGTTDIFTRYLAVVSDPFRSQFQTDGSFKWAIGTAIEADNNGDMATKVSQNDYSIGYVDQSAVTQPDYQRQADATPTPTIAGQTAKPTLPYAEIRNKTGRFIYPTRDTVSAAANGSFIPDDFRTYIVDAEGTNTYPIVGFTWIIVWRDLTALPNPSKDKATALTAFLWWAIHKGQEDLPVGYAPLPTSLVPRLERLFVTEKRNNPVDKVFLYDKQPLLPQP